MAVTINSYIASAGAQRRLDIVGSQYGSSTYAFIANAIQDQGQSTEALLSQIDSG